MVALLTKTEIQSLYIDTVEKALVFGALFLRAALVGSDDANADNLNAALNLSAVSDTEGNLNLEVYIPYSAYILNSKGGKLLDAVEEYQSNSPNLYSTIQICSKSSKGCFPFFQFLHHVQKWDQSSLVLQGLLCPSNIVKMLLY